MNNSRKTTYLIALFAISLLFLNIFTSVRFYNGYNLNREALIGFNVEDLNEVAITRKGEFVSFESGYVFNIDIADLPLENGNIVSMAVPVNNLEKNTTYQAVLSLDLDTNTTLPFTIESNSKLTPEEKITPDLTFKSKSVAVGMHDYDIEIEFSTNNEGVGYIIFNFPVDEGVDNFHLTIDNMQIKNFKEIENGADVDSESESETSIESAEE